MWPSYSGALDIVTLHYCDSSRLAAVVLATGACALLSAPNQVWAVPFLRATLCKGERRVCSAVRTNQVQAVFILGPHFPLIFYW